jgi:hypothetical protein
MEPATLWAKEPWREAYAARSQHVWMDVEPELRSFARCDLVESFRPLDALAYRSVISSPIAALGLTGVGCPLLPSYGAGAR